MSPQLLAIAPVYFAESNAMLPQAALSVLGLHLRLREDYVYHHIDSLRIETGSKSFYSMLVDSILPEWWRWSVLCPRPADPLDPSPAGLTEAIHVRITRALRARDRLHGQFLRVPSDDTVDEALMHFESFLVAFAGAFDCAARVADQAYELARPRQASWRKKEWLKDLCSKDPDLGPMVSDETTVRKVIDLVFLLRNTIHEETLKPIGVIGRNDRIEQYDAAIPTEVRNDLLNCVAALGGERFWGLTALGSDFIAIDIPIFTERALTDGVRVLNQLLAAIRVERFGLNPLSTYDAPEDIATDAPWFLELAGLV
ncbi:MAG TPA: hypothetical protein VFW00_10975 [Rhodocyclaceae bacterium]|nr:hypothetical protein [Rhodocyclaceae bacterium]